jgi:hypothetical protein
MKLTLTLLLLIINPGFSFSQKLDTLNLIADAIEINFEIFQNLSQKSDYSDKQVICIRDYYKALPLIGKTILHRVNFELVLTDCGELFHFGVKKFFTVSRIRIRKREAFIFYEIESLKKDEVFGCGTFHFKKLNGTWTFNELRDVVWIK